MEIIHEISILRINSVEGILKNKYDIKSLRERFDENSYIELKINDLSYDIISNEELIYLTALENKHMVKAKIIDDNTDVLLEKLIDELVNKKLNPMIMSIYINELQNVFGVKQAHIAKRAGLTYGAISNKQRLNNLPMKVQSALINETIKERHGRAILRLKNLDNYAELSEQVLNQVISEKLKVSECDNIVSELLGLPQTKYESLNIKNLDKSKLVNPEVQVVINSVQKELSEGLKNTRQYFPNLEIILESGVDKEDYVFLLKLKGINKNG